MISDAEILLMILCFKVFKNIVALPFADNIISSLFTGDELLKVFKAVFESNDGLYV